MPTAEIAEIRERLTSLEKEVTRLRSQFAIAGRPDATSGEPWIGRLEREQRPDVRAAFEALRAHAADGDDEGTPALLEELTAVRGMQGRRDG